MELYHIHNNNKHNRKWEVGSEIIVNDSFNNGMNERKNRFTTNFEGMNYHDELAFIYQEITSRKNLTKDDYELVKAILEKSYNVSYYANMFKRETALENCRLDNYGGLPSRLHTIYLTDENGLDYWTSVIPSDDAFSIYKVKVEDVFRTSETLLPDERLNYIDTYHKAHKYWSGISNEKQDPNSEYLVSGKVKILQKIK